MSCLSARQGLFHSIGVGTLYGKGIKKGIRQIYLIPYIAFKRAHCSNACR